MVRLAAVGAALIMVSACTSSGSGAGMGAFVAPPIAVAEPGPALEKQLNLVVWDGYAEAAWTDEFVKETGCKVHAQVAGSSDEMVALVKSGQYDVVSASGDASLRMIASGDVAPVDVSRVPNYKDIYPSLKLKSWNSVNNVPYGIPHGRGANVLLYNKDKVKPEPSSWSAVYDPASPYAGKITAYDSPISIADAALYLMSARTDLNIKNPYALDRTQFDAAVALLKKQHALVKSYWSDASLEQQDFQNGVELLGTSWQVVLNRAKSAGATNLATKVPAEGATGWADTWMITSAAKNPGCAYKWLDFIVSPKINAEVAESYGEAPANSLACGKTSDPTFCTQYHADEASYWDRIYSWTTPTEPCLDGSDRVCVPYNDWVTAWNEIKQS